MFAGYSLRTAQAVARLRQLPVLLRRGGTGLPGIGSLCALSLRDEASLYAESRRHFTIEQVARLVSPEAGPAEAIESHIQLMRDELSRAQRIAADLLRKGTVTIGTDIEVLGEGMEASERYRILGPWDADPDRGVLSYTAPFCQAFLGAGEGERVTVRLPGGEEKRYTILSVKPAI